MKTYIAIVDKRGWPESKVGVTRVFFHETEPIDGILATPVVVVTRACVIPLPNCCIFSYNLHDWIRICQYWVYIIKMTQNEDSRISQWIFRWSRETDRTAQSQWMSGTCTIIEYYKVRDKDKMQQHWWWNEMTHEIFRKEMLQDTGSNIPFSSESSIWIRKVHLYQSFLW